MCDCEFDTDPEDEDVDQLDYEPWQYLRTCENCGDYWYGLHCPHDGVQNPCPGCMARPTPVPDLSIND